MNRTQIAQVAHAVNLAYCLALGDSSHKPWAETTDEIRAGYEAAVDMHLANPDTTPEQAHAAWLAAKTAAGWTYGEVKDAEAKTHPCMLPFEQLPESQRAKDAIVKAVVLACAAVAGTDDQAPAPAAVGVEVGLIDASTLPVKYIGRREVHVDGLYGTRLQWARGQTLMVQKAVAVQMLRHQDVYAMGEPVITSGPIPVAKDAVSQEQEQIQDAVDQINSMSKNALARFCKELYGVDLQMKDSLATLRTTATNLVHQFGLG